jgi:GNAT superfamily N-acetyltransferase
MNATITLRPITDDDQEFLYRLYASTREEELAQVDWDAAQKEAFLRMQFRAQHNYYQEHYTRATFDVIEVDGEPAGRLYLDEREDEIRIVDIALLPSFRNRGIGSGFMQTILARAESLGLPVRIHVERYNPAMRLYDRLGFRQIGDTGVYYLMERSPGHTNGSDADAQPAKE